MSSYVDFLFETLVEAPLADFGAYGDLSREGSLRPDDLKAVQNPKWLKKLDSHFSRTPYRFNLYVYNATGDGYHAGDAQRHVVIPHAEPEFADNENFARRIDPRKISSNNLMGWAGLYRAEKFKTLFGFVPPEVAGHISILLIQNEGDGRIPLTPWMMAHRIAHAMQYGGAGAYEPTRKELSNSEIQSQNHRVVKIIEKAYRDAASIFQACPLYRERLEMPDQQILAAAKRIGRTAAMREGRIDRWEEIIVETMAQFIVQGGVRFNPPPELGEDFAWNGEPMNQNVFRRTMASHAVKINREMTTLLNMFVGQILVF